MRVIVYKDAQVQRYGSRVHLGYERRIYAQTRVGFSRGQIAERGVSAVSVGHIRTVSEESYLNQGPAIEYPSTARNLGVREETCIS